MLSSNKKTKSYFAQPYLIYNIINSLVNVVNSFVNMNYAERTFFSQNNWSNWTSPGGNTPQDTNYTATGLPSRELSKLDEPDMQDTAGEVGTSS